MTEPVDFATLTPAELIVGEDAQETGLLRGMLRQAEGYITGFRWCPLIDRIYLGCGVGGVVAVFLVHFNEPVNGTDEWLWVVVGDVPSAYLVVDQAHSPAAALDVYCELMERWANSVLEGRTLQDAFPVDAEPTHEDAEDLMTRVSFIRTRLLPEWRDKWEAE